MYFLTKSLKICTGKKTTLLTSDVWMYNTENRFISLTLYKKSIQSMSVFNIRSEALRLLEENTEKAF
jgi:hypothetical protein